MCQRMRANRQAVRICEYPDLVGRHHAVERALSGIGAGPGSEPVQALEPFAGRHWLQEGMQVEMQVCSICCSRDTVFRSVLGTTQYTPKTLIANPQIDFTWQILGLENDARQ